ncbi:pre-mRNA-splicing factor SLU7-like isoform X2 [Xenia sp. Carnegie-2017]|uniref:pre-mRNA-splicing factor SLU7-like isoform X2 n=1 Tax=Xenia sp. Carnegie-2017 TaxID=2897299 RepID=UPI001F04DACE|nr:pre-mRNA-splicing factor SLU7-like isoform X2 [Xenia sp. Carnegie-2017]
MASVLRSLDLAASAASSQQKMIRTDWKKEKELEEARKAGTAPALQDETGKDINPHIPQYIWMPWYYGASGPTLKHQRPQEERQKQFAKIDASYKRGLKERPRRVGAKFTGEDIKPDEYVPEQHSFDYDGKRDRWVGYDPEEHQRVLEEYQKMEMAKQQLKSDKLHQDLMDGKKVEEKKLSDDDDEDKYADDVIIPGQKFDSKRRVLSWTRPPFSKDELN